MITVSFDDDYLAEMKKDHKPEFWSTNVISLLLVDIEPMKDKFFTPETTNFNVLTVRGPVSSGVYEIDVEGQRLDKDGQRVTCSPRVILNVRVNFSVSDFSQKIRKNPRDTVTNGSIILHKLQKEAFGKYKMDITSLRYDFPNLTANQRLFWSAGLVNEVLAEIENKILTDSVGGGISSHFPPSTNKLEIQNIKINTRCDNMSTASYILEVIPRNQDEKLSLDPVNIEIKLPKKIFNHAIEIGKEAHKLFAVVPAIKIISLYSTKKYEHNNEKTSSLESLAQSMMSALAGAKIAAQVDTFEHTALESRSQIKNEEPELEKDLTVWL